MLFELIRRRLDNLVFDGSVNHGISSRLYFIKCSVNYILLKVSSNVCKFKWILPPCGNYGCICYVMFQLNDRHPVHRMRDAVDESADGSGIREIRQGTVRKCVRQNAGCITFGAATVLE